MTISHGLPVIRMLLSQFGTAFDVGKEEGNGAAGQGCHEVSIQGVWNTFKQKLFCLPFRRKDYTMIQDIWRNS